MTIYIYERNGEKLAINVEGKIFYYIVQERLVSFIYKWKIKKKESMFVVFSLKT